MVLKEFPDGSQFDGKHLAVAVALGAIGAAALTGMMMKYDKWSTKRLMKKHGWSQQAIDRV